jgi:hypothetical protein
MRGRRHVPATHPPAMSYRVDPVAADEVDQAGAQAAIKELGPAAEGG